MPEDEGPWTAHRVVCSPGPKDVKCTIRTYGSTWRGGVHVTVTRAYLGQDTIEVIPQNVTLYGHKGGAYVNAPAVCEIVTSRGSKVLQCQRATSEEVDKAWRSALPPGILSEESK